MKKAKSVSALKSQATKAKAKKSRGVTSSTDRLSFTTFVALAIHGFIIFGISFSQTSSDTPAATIDVTLATQFSKEAPDATDFLAQFNQQGSGSEDEAKEVTTDKEADFSDNSINEVTPPPQIKEQDVNDKKTAVLTADSGKDSVESIQEQTQKDQQQKGNADQTITLYNQEIASLQARLAQNRQAYAKRPKVKRLTQVSAKAADDAAYLLSWSQKVEQVGNNNFPKEAVANNITGALRLLCILKPDGSIDRVEILESSGHKILDASAQQIVRMAAPYEAFPPSIKKDTDRLEIIRTWHFEVGGLSTSD